MESFQIEIEGLPWLVSLIFDGLIATETADLPYTETQGSRGENLACAALFFILRPMTVRLYPSAPSHCACANHLHSFNKDGQDSFICVNRIYSLAKFHCLY